MAVASYGSATDSSGVVRILKDLDAPIAGRGGPDRRGHRPTPAGPFITCFGALGRATRRASRFCALLTKPGRRKVDLPTRYVGFEIANRFAVGYGLDHAERYRNLAFVAALADSLTLWARQAPGAPGVPGTLEGLANCASNGFANSNLSHDEPGFQRRVLPDRDRHRAGVLRLTTDPRVRFGHARADYSR